MLYDKRWDASPVGTKPVSFTWSNLVAWLEAMPPAERYCFTDTGDCLLGQWAKSIDPLAQTISNENSFTYTVHGRAVNLMPFYIIAIEHPRTFGGALKRAYRADRRMNGAWCTRAYYSALDFLF